MFNKEVFKEKIANTQKMMKASLRGELDGKVEMHIIDDLSSIYNKMTDRFEHNVLLGSQFPAQPGVVDHPEHERVFHAILDLLERMELDFSQKFVLDFQHGREKEIEIGKIKISFLDGVRRGLNSTRTLA